MYLIFFLLVSVWFLGGHWQAWPAHAEPDESPSPLLVEQQQDSGNQALLDKAKTSFEIQEFDEALATLESLIEREPSAPLLEEAYFLQAAILRTTNQERGAASIMEQLLDEFPMSPLANETRLLLGQLYLNLEKPERAIKVLQQVFDFSTDPALRQEALEQIREAYVSHEQFVEAIQTTMDEIALVDLGQQAELKTIIQDLILQKMDQTSLQDLIEAYPNRYPGDLATIRLIELHTAHGDEVLAERDIRTFLQHFPTHPYAQTAMALLQSFMHKIKINAHVIAAFLPFSGPIKSFGTDSLNGIRLALEDGKEQFGLSSIGLVVKDTASTTGSLRYELAQVLNDFTPIAAIGPLLSREIQSVSHLADDYEIPILTPSATLLDVRRFGSYWFSTALTATLQVRQLVDYAMTQLGYTRFCIIAPQTAYGREMSQLFTQAVEYFGGKLIAVESYSEQETDIAEQIVRLKDTDLANDGEMTEEKISQKKIRKIYTPGFDAVFVPGKPINLALIASQLAFYDINVPLLGANSWHDPDIFRWARHGIETGVFTDGFFLNSPDPSIQAFTQRYRARFGTDPSLFSVQAYDATWLILDAIRKGAVSGKDVREQFLRRHDLPILNSFASFGSTGVLNRKIYILQVRKGQFVQIN
ncbi:MAG: penicillin-binding protein activator [Nitrospirales bacterium]|nr:penicillin-binding protein activator [Nitrospira sp.]MDR4500236.1 penicillin-binding protein activator [Nitrospirales bacterium]